MSTRGKRRDSFARSRADEMVGGRELLAEKNGAGKTRRLSAACYHRDTAASFDARRRGERTHEIFRTLRPSPPLARRRVNVARLSRRERVRESSRVARLVARRGPNWHAPLPPSLFAAARRALLPPLRQDIATG